MKLTKRSGLGGRIPKISKALDKSGYRPVLSGAMLKVEEDKWQGSLLQKRVVMYATNSYFFVKNVLEGLTVGDIKNLEGAQGPIPEIALKHMEKGVDFDVREDGIRVGLATYDRKLSEAAQGNENFPDFAALKPDKPKRAFRVSMNAQLMADLSAALGSDQLVFEFDMDRFSSDSSDNRGGEDGDQTYLRAIQVKTSGGNQSEALIMPIRLGG